MLTVSVLVFAFLEKVHWEEGGGGTKQPREEVAPPGLGKRSYILIFFETGVLVPEIEPILWGAKCKDNDFV